MKNVKILLLLKVAALGFSCTAQQSVEENIRVKMLGYEFQNGAFYCSQVSEDDLNTRQNLIIRANNNLTFVQWYAALTFEIDGKDAITNTESQDCEGVCGEYLERLKMLKSDLKFIIEDLKAGDLTREEFNKNDKLVAQLHTFRYKAYMQEQEQAFLESLEAEDLRY